MYIRVVYDWGQCQHGQVMSVTSGSGDITKLRRKAKRLMFVVFCLLQPWRRQVHGRRQQDERRASPYTRCRHFWSYLQSPCAERAADYLLTCSLTCSAPTSLALDGSVYCTFACCSCCTLYKVRCLSHCLRPCVVC